MAGQIIGATSPVETLVGADADEFLKLGLMYSSGSTVPLDYVEAQKWFHVAVARGCRAAMAHRADLAAELSHVEAAEAQRAARRFLQLH